MTTQLVFGADSKPAPSGTGVFGVIATVLQESARKVGCWDNARFVNDERGGRGTMSHGFQPIVTDESLAYAFAKS